MKAILIIVTTFLSLSIMAADRNAAYEQICKPLPFDTSRRDCANKLKKYSYFDDRALYFCSTLAFDSSRLSCMELVGDRVYEEYEMESCLNEVFESKKLECLKTSGTVYNPNSGTCLDRIEVIHQLSLGIKELRAGNTRFADKVMTGLLGKFQNCPIR